jgi:hypothetical protein
MTADQLKEIGVENFGDRVALMAHANACKPVNSHEKQSNEILDKITATVSNKRKKWTRLKGNENARKCKRKIEMGWLYTDGENRTKQVRQNHGGGTRAISVDTSLTSEELVELGKGLFFPGGKSVKGDMRNFVFSIATFDRSPLDSSKTIADLYEDTGFKILRLYLWTKPTKEKPTTATSSAGDSTSFSATMGEFTTIDDDSFGKQSSDVAAGASTSFSTPVGESTAYESFDTQPSYHSCVENYEQEDFSDLMLFQADATHDTEIGLRSRAILSITVHRGHVLKELEDFFIHHDPECGPGMIVEASMILPNGVLETGEDTGGIFRDMIAEYWESFYSTRCEGAELKVPVLAPSIDSKRWKAVASIIAMGYHVEKYLPVRIAPSFLQYAIDGKADLEEDILIQQYLKYLPEVDRNSISTALDDFEVADLDELLEFYDNHGCRSKPEAETFRTVIRDVAHKELIQCPSFIAEAMRDRLLNLIGCIEKPITDLSYLVPTFRRVWPCIQFDGVSTELQKMFKAFIRTLDESMMMKFLRFCTGKYLTVSFC